MLYFGPPGRRERRGRHPLFGRLEFLQGVSLLKKDGLYRQVETPTDEECADADRVYLGGRVYLIDAEEAAALEAAGYGAWIDDRTPVLVGYGEGAYGEGFYGGGEIGTYGTPYGDGLYGEGPYGGV